MFWTRSRRLIASLVGFFVGWTVFQIVRPVENLPEVELPEIQILAIKLESLGCTDSELECPVFEMTLRSDGTGSYVGHANSYFTGQVDGSVSHEDFEHLVDELYKQEFLRLPEHFSREPLEETIVVEVLTNQGSHRVTSYSWQNTPGELRTLHALIQYQFNYVDWQEVK